MSRARPRPPASRPKARTKATSQSAWPGGVSPTRARVNVTVFSESAHPHPCVARAADRAPRTDRNSAQLAVSRYLPGARGRARRRSTRAARARNERRGRRERRKRRRQTKPTRRLRHRPCRLRTQPSRGRCASRRTRRCTRARHDSQSQATKLREHTGAPSLSQPRPTNKCKACPPLRTLPSGAMLSISPSRCVCCY